MTTFYTAQILINFLESCAKKVDNLILNVKQLELHLSLEQWQDKN